MKDKQNHEVEELINAYLDGQATQRQQTELKRLMLHDPQMNQRIKVMERQKQILNALPLETAPEDLADLVRAALERRLILDNAGDHHHTAGQARFRRLMTVAAMFLLPLGLLGLIVYQVMRPPAADFSYGSPDQFSTAAAPSNGTTDAQMPFDGLLTFQTPQLAAVSGYIEKIMFDQDLIEAAAPERSADAAAYLVKAAPEKIAALLDSIAETWNRSSSVSLILPSGTDAAALEIPDISIEQVKTLAAQSDSAVLAQMAVQYAAANRNQDSAYARGSDSADRLGPDGLPLVNQPIMTGRYERSHTPSEDAGRLVSLRIQIKRSAD